VVFCVCRRDLPDPVARGLVRASSGRNRYDLAVCGVSVNVIGRSPVTDPQEAHAMGLSAATIEDAHVCDRV
jgi:hypothetical protein